MGGSAEELFEGDLELIQCTLLTKVIAGQDNPRKYELSDEATQVGGRRCS